MKNKSVYGTVFILLLCFAACGGGNDTELAAQLYEPDGIFADETALMAEEIQPPAQESTPASLSESPQEPNLSEQDFAHEQALRNDIGYNAYEFIIPLGTYNDLFSIHGDFCVVSRNGEVGVVDFGGNEILPIGFGGYSHINHVHNGLFSVTRDGQHAVVDAEGNEILPFGTDFGRPIIHDNAFTVRRNGSWAVIDLDGNEIIPFGRYARHWGTAAGLIRAEHQSRHGLVDIDGREVVPLGMFDTIRHSRSNDMIIVVLNGQYAVVTLEEQEEIVPFGMYDLIWGMDYGMLRVVRDGEDGVVSLSGEEIIPFGMFERIEQTASPDRFVVYRRIGEPAGVEYAVVDASGTEIIPFGEYPYLSNIIGTPLFFISDCEMDGSRGVVNSYGQVIIPIDHYFRIGSVSFCPRLGYVAVAANESGIGIIRFVRNE